MRKKIKNSLLDVFNTLVEAHSAIKDYIDNGDVDNAVSLLGECQNAAVEIGTTIDKQEREGTETVHLLEEYCESAYSLANCLINEEETGIAFDRLKSILSKSENSLISEIKENHEVLMIAYYFPPLGGSGVYRSIKFAKYLPDYGWSPTIISAEEPPIGWNFYDKSLVDEIPDSVDVRHIKDLFSKGGEKKISISRINEIFRFVNGILCNEEKIGNLYIKTVNSEGGYNFLLGFPDQQISWSYDAVHYIEKNLDINDYDCVYTTSGPYSAHLVGAYLKEKYGIPWIADYRDQWTANPLNKLPETNITFRFLLNLEKNLLNIASFNIAVAPSALSDYTGRLGVRRDKISYITNGYDESDFIALTEPEKRDSKFTILFSGLLYGDNQTLKPVLDALLDLCNEGLMKRENIVLRVVGCIDKKNADIINELKCNDIFDVIGYTPHVETIQYNLKSDILLMITGDGKQNKSWIPGKLFDYLRSRRPILALIPKNGDAANILRESGRGEAMLSTEGNKIKQFIINEYKKWENGEPYTCYELSNIEKYERKVLTGKLADIFNENIWVGNGRYEEFSDAVYDNMYKKSGDGNEHVYHLHYSKSNYYQSWNKVINYLNKFDHSLSILEIGCGPGQFANMLIDNGFKNYTGFDFSKEAINIAKKTNIDYADSFFVADAFTTDLLDKEYDMIICFEVLEHIQKDIELLERIKPNTNVVLSVPNFDDPNHVRFFETDEEVRKRYENIISISEINTSVINGPFHLFYIIGKKK